MRRFYAPPENFDRQQITLALDETRHLRDVLRLREAARLHVFDGCGREFSCEILKIKKKETTLRIIEEIAPTAPESDLDLTLASALLKGEKFDLVVQKAVELGAAKFVPLATKRADVKLKETEKKLERWRKIVVEATKQCGRAKLMQIESPVGFEEFVEKSTALRGANETLLLFAERGGADFSSAVENKKIIAITGAEGGWEDAEIKAARDKNFQIITFGSRILRAETAVIAVAAILQHRFGDLS